MATLPVILCDTNIFIEVYRNNADIIAALKKIGQPNIAISAVSAAELLFGARTKTELAAIQKDIKQLTLLHINEDISAMALQLVDTFSLSHKLAIPDALIAATALSHNLQLFTLNTKDFKFITGLKHYKP